MSDTYRKYWKAKFSDIYTASIVIEKKCARLAGDAFNIIEVTNKGINIQPGPGSDVSIQTLSVKGPLTRKTPFPFTLIPGPFSFPTDIIDVPFIDIAPELGAIAGAMAGLAAASV